MISVKYALTKEDYINYYTFVMWDSPEKKKSKLKYQGRQILINLIFIAVLFYSNIFRYNQIYLYVYGAIVVIGAIWQYIFGRNNVRNQAVRVADNPDNSAIYLDNHTDISDTGIVLKDAVSQVQYSWQAFIKKEETTDYYFLFTSSIQAVILPKRIFRQATEKEQFEKLMRQHLSFEAEVGHLLNG